MYTQLKTSFYDKVIANHTDTFLKELYAKYKINEKLLESFEDHKRDIQILINTKGTELKHGDEKVDLKDILIGLDRIIKDLKSKK